VDVHELVSRLRAWKGTVRKGPISEVAGMLLPGREGPVLAAYGEDAAAIRHRDSVLLLAADGILEDLVRADPYWAGYCSVLVNANDIAAMGGTPLAAVNVLSCSDEGVRSEIVRGMRDGCTKFSVPMVGGHLHPDTTYSAVDVAMLGHTSEERLVLSDGARPGDAIVFAMDLDGEFTQGVPYSWDTTSRKNADEVASRLRSIRDLAGMLSAAKDISNPGAMGTLGMLLEASGAGGEVDVDLVPSPDGVDLVQWLTAYQGCGFVATCRAEHSRGVVEGFTSRGLTASAAGVVTDSRRLVISLSGESANLFDLSEDCLGCRRPQSL
jgi:putative methanogenesis marker protein 2